VFGSEAEDRAVVSSNLTDGILNSTAKQKFLQSIQTMEDKFKILKTSIMRIITIWLYSPYGGNSAITLSRFPLEDTMTLILRSLICVLDVERL
jgi:hypothetical protein